MQTDLIQTLMGVIGSVGFALMFGVRDRKLVWIALGSGLGWVVYLLCRASGHSLFVGMFVASLWVAVLSEVLARWVKTPVILLLVPMLIPEIPGGDLYYTMYRLLAGDTVGFGLAAKQVLGEAGAIALGIILASYGAGLWNNIRLHLHSRPRRSVSPWEKK